MTIEINNIGPIEHVRIPIPEGGGVVVMRGRNGSGKSTAIEAVGRLARGSDLRAKPRHGSKKGSIEGFGATVQVGMKRVIGEGQLVVEAFDKRIDIGRLVDPGIKDPESADRQRIQTACALAGVESDASLWGTLAPGLEAELQVGDLMEQAKNVRKELHRRAREHEDEATRLQERARVLQAEAGEVEDFDFTDEAAQANLEAAISEHSALKARAEAATAARERGEKAKAWLAQQGKAPDLDALNVTLQAAFDRRDEAEALVEECEKKLIDARLSHAKAADAVRHARSELEAGEKLAEHRAAADAALADATKHAGACPTAEQLAEAERKVAQARKDIALAAAAARADEKKQQAKAALEEREAVRDQADAARAAADRVDDILAQHLAAVMPQGLRVIDSRLVLERGTRLVPFAELSDGERWTIALDIAIEAMPAAGVIPIEQPAWEGLDGEARRAIAAHAKKRGITIITAEADHGAEVGALRAEEFDG